MEKKGSIAAGRRILTSVLSIALSLLFLTGIDYVAANSLPRPESLSAGEVQQILRQAVAESQARGTPATIAVVDRVGNVLAVYQMIGTTPNVRIDARRAVVPPSGLVALPPLPAEAAAIAKAITGAYLSSGGNAFSTRTASQIVQENFNPGPTGLEGSPLFGVQFSQLPCSDLSVRFASNNCATKWPSWQISSLSILSAAWLEHRMLGREDLHHHTFAD
jgi:hypothetical protein